MKISACVITKNEEAVIGRCINSFKDAADEIIVVDSGSADRTVRIARSLGAKVHYRPWNDDFAAAKNYALSFVTGKYVIFLDADEWFDCKSDIRGAVEILDGAHGKDGIMVAMRHYNTNDFTSGTDVPITRIFKSGDKMRYHNKIHEVILNDGKSLDTIECPKSMLLLHHTGYVSGVSAGKARRNLNLLLKELNEQGGSARLYGYLGDTYSSLERHAEAVYYSGKFIECNVSIGSYQAGPYNSLCASLANVEPDKLIETALEAAERFPGQAVFNYHAAKEYLRRREFDNAIGQYKIAAGKLDSFLSAKNNLINLMPADMDMLNFYIARTYAMSGDRDLARRYAGYINRKFRYAADYLYFIHVISLDFDEFIKKISEIYDLKNKKDARFLAVFLSGIKCVKLCGDGSFFYKNYIDNFGGDTYIELINMMTNHDFTESSEYARVLYKSSLSADYARLFAVSVILSQKYTNEEYLPPSYVRIIKSAFSDTELVKLLPKDLDVLKSAAESAALYAGHGGIIKLGGALGQMSECARRNLIADIRERYVDAQI